jgi:hypothetical protein
LTLCGKLMSSVVKRETRAMAELCTMPDCIRSVESARASAFECLLATGIDSLEKVSTRANGWWSSREHALVTVWASLTFCIGTCAGDAIVAAPSLVGTCRADRPDGLLLCMWPGNTGWLRPALERGWPRLLYQRQCVRRVPGSLGLRPFACSAHARSVV